MQNVAQTVISQYAESPIINALIADMNAWVDPQADLTAFYNDIWNINTAQGYGLDVWGRILGVTRVVQIPTAGLVFGFQQQVAGGDIDTFGFANFAGSGANQNYSLSDAQFRLLLLAKAATNISSGSIPAINAILLALFPGRGDVYVTDGENMTMTYHFTFSLSIVELAIIGQSGVLPKPVGVAASVVHP